MGNQPRRVEEIVRTALDLGPEDREAFLDDACGEDANLRRSVETWLRIHLRSRTQTELPPTPAPGPIARPTPLPAPPPLQLSPPPSRRSSFPVLLLLVLLVSTLGLFAWYALQTNRYQELARVEADMAREQALKAEQIARKTAELQRLQEEEDLRAVLDFVINDLAGVKGSLEGVEKRLIEVAGSNGEREAALREALGAVHLARGEAKAALDQFEKASKHRDTPTLQKRLTEARGLVARATVPILRMKIDALQQEDQHAQAEPLLREVVTLLRAHPPADPLDLSIQETLLGRNLLLQEKYSEAEPVLRSALASIEKLRADQWPTYDTRSLLGSSLLGQKKYSEAEPLLVGGYEGLKQREAQMPEAARPRITEAGLRVIALYEAWGKADEAAAWKQKVGG